MTGANKLRDKIISAPDSAGVYMFKDVRGRILYIGKAKSLKKRLGTYLGRDLSTKTVALMSNVNDVEYKLTPTESLSLLLEANLIHKYKPKYNVSLRDDKSFPMVKITNEEFPAICITRKKELDGSRYFGPYTNAGLLRQALKIIRRHFPYRSCKELPSQECIYYSIGLSPAPCTGKISKKEYTKTINNISLILEGKTESLLKRLSKEMRLRAKNKEFEQAARIRDQINALGSLGQAHTSLSRQEELEELKKILNLEKNPQRIEAFDISDIYGKEAVGSMVSFYKGLPDKDNYRRFRIKTVSTIDDYKMLGEVVYRRYSRVLEEKLPFPDLILIDGGKGHLISAERELKRIGLQIPLTSIAKQEENIYALDRRLPIKLSQNNPALNLIRRVRDEAHRFAVSYHHILRRKKVIGK